jgi:hypothetical protein
LAVVLKKFVNCRITCVGSCPISSNKHDGDRQSSASDCVADYSSGVIL